MSFLIVGIIIMFLIRFGEPSQIDWRGADFDEVRRRIEHLLGLAHYQRARAANGAANAWQRWTRERTGWRRWLPTPEIQLRSDGDRITIRGNRDFISLLRLKL